MKARTVFASFVLVICVAYGAAIAGQASSVAAPEQLTDSSALPNILNAPFTVERDGIPAFASEFNWGAIDLSTLRGLARTEDAFYAMAYGDNSGEICHVAILQSDSAGGFIGGINCLPTQEFRSNGLMLSVAEGYGETTIRASVSVVAPNGYQGAIGSLRESGEIELYSTSNLIVMTEPTRFNVAGGAEVGLNLTLAPDHVGDKEFSLRR